MDAAAKSPEIENFHKNAIMFWAWTAHGKAIVFTNCGLLAVPSRKLRTTNMVEFQNKQLKKRTRCIRVFPNKESLLRIATALLIELDEKWLANGKVYLKGWRQRFGEFTEKTLRSHALLNNVLSANGIAVTNVVLGYMDLFNDFFPVNLREVRAVNE